MLNIFKKKKPLEECDHTYFTHRGHDGKIDGQECSICKYLNPLKNMGLTKEQIEFMRNKM